VRVGLWFYSLAIYAVLLNPCLAQEPPPAPPQRQGPVFGGANARPFTPQPAQAPAPQPAPAPNPATPSTTPAQPPRPATAPTIYGGLALNNASLTEVIDLLAQKLKINYILDPRVKGGVILNTYGETKDIDTRSLLETILRINGFGMVKQGELYRIVPLSDISHLPIPPERKTDPDQISEDDQTMLNLVFLKYVLADELAKVLEPFQGENARMYVYAPANLLLMLDSRRSMRRSMELVAMFDSDQLANERVHLFTLKNGRPSDVARELENISKAVALSDKNSPIKFLPIDRINTIIAVAPNPGAFTEVQKWLDKLDVPIRASAGGIKDYVYKVHYGDAISMACSIQALYGQLYGGFSPGFGAGQNAILACIGTTGVNNSTYGGGGFGAGVGGAYGAGAGGGAYGGGGGGGYGGAYGAYGGGGAYGSAGYGNAGYGNGNGYGGNPNAYGAAGTPFSNPAGSAVPGAAGATGTGDLTGTYLGNAPVGFAAVRRPRVVANPINNTLLIQATQQEYEDLQQLIKELDIPPRQVLIEAKIYSVDLNRSTSTDISGALQTLGTTASTTAPTTATLLAGLANGFGGLGGGSGISAAMVVGKSRELLGTVSLLESESKAKVLSSPSIIATDSIPASINVGTTVPTLQGSITSAIGGAVTNSIGSASTGIGLTILARVSPSGIVTMVINQNVSDPEATTVQNAGSSIASPSFGTKSIQTQVTVQDGDTIAIGGMIQESTTSSLSGLPLLDRIPVLGGLFGSRSYSKERTELIMFLTPHVIFDSNQLLDASDELKDQIKVLRKDVKE
jgi:general secretion pathway protein D